MLTNPALAKTTFLNCDVFSLGKIERVDKKDDAFIRMLKNPNRFQTQRQWLWTYRFWLMYGNAYLKPNTKLVANDTSQLYWLDSSRMDWDKARLENLDQMVLSNKKGRSIEKVEVGYEYLNGKTESFKLGELLPFHDLTNNTGNWYRGESRVDALHKILANNESLLDAKNINLEFVRKFLVSGNYDPTKNLSSFMTLQNVEKEDIEQKIRGNKSVLPIKSQVTIERFVENLADLKLDESYTSDLLVVADMYGIPKELISVLLEGSTYENQEKALSRHISYSEMPKAQDLLEGLCSHFGLNAEDYHMTWDYLSFMQHDEFKRSQVTERNARTLGELIALGVPPQEALDYLKMDEISISDELREQNRQGQTEEAPQGEEEETEE